MSTQQTNPEKIIIYSTTRTSDVIPQPDLDRISLLYKDPKKVSEEVSDKVNYLLNENKRLSSLLFQAEDQSKDLQNALNSIIQEKDKEIQHLNNKINFMENEMASRFAEYERKFLNISQETSNSSKVEARIQTLNEKIFEMTKDNQESYSLIMKKSEENRLLHEQITELTMKYNDQVEIVLNTKKDIEQLESLNVYKENELSSLNDKIAFLTLSNNKNQANLEILLNENTRLQKILIETNKKNEAQVNSLLQELERKNFELSQYENVVLLSNEKIHTLEEEKNQLTLEFALDHLKIDEKFKEENDRIKEIAANTDILENLNILLSEKISENEVLQSTLADLKQALAHKEEENNKNMAVIAKLQKGLEKLLLHVDSLNMIVTNQRERISQLEYSLDVYFEILDESKNIALSILSEKSTKYVINSKEDFISLFHDLKSAFRTLNEKLGVQFEILSEKLLTLLVINENLNNIMENNFQLPEDREKPVMNEIDKKRYEAIISDLKKKINLILGENAKLNQELVKTEQDRTKIFKSWTEGREKIENASLQNELANAKRNIMLLLRNNKELVEKCKIAQANSWNNVMSSTHQIDQKNQEKLIFQINSLKKQNDILKEMNKNRGMVIENLLKKLKNQRLTN